MDSAMVWIIIHPPILNSLAFLSNWDEQWLLNHSKFHSILYYMLMRPFHISCFYSPLVLLRVSQLWRPNWRPYSATSPGTSSRGQTGGYRHWWGEQLAGSHLQPTEVHSQPVGLDWRCPAFLQFCLICPVYIVYVCVCVCVCVCVRARVCMWTENVYLWNLHACG